MKARAERLAADLIHVLYEDEEVGEELADAVLEALIDQAHLASGYVRASQKYLHQEKDDDLMSASKYFSGIGFLTCDER